MKVKELKKILEGFGDEEEVFVSLTSPHGDARWVDISEVDATNPHLVHLGEVVCE